MSCEKKKSVSNEQHMKSERNKKSRRLVLKYGPAMNRVDGRSRVLEGPTPPGRSTWTRPRFSRRHQPGRRGTATSPDCRDAVRVSYGSAVVDPTPSYEDQQLDPAVPTWRDGTSGRALRGGAGLVGICRRLSRSPGKGHVQRDAPLPRPPRRGGHRGDRAKARGFTSAARLPRGVWAGCRAQKLARCTRAPR